MMALAALTGQLASPGRLWEGQSGILINGVAPYFIYFVLHHQFQVAELPALVATSIPPLLDALVGIVRWRRIDFLQGMAARECDHDGFGCDVEATDACAVLD